MDALLWQLQEGPPSELEAWARALEAALEAAGGSEERRLLFLPAADRRLGGPSQAAVQVCIISVGSALVPVCVLVGHGSCKWRVSGCWDARCRPMRPLQQFLLQLLPFLQSPEFLRAQEAAVDVLAVTALTLDLLDRLCSSPSTGHSASPSPAALRQQRLLAVAGSSLSLLAGPLPALLRGGCRGSALLEGVLTGYGTALELAQEIEVRGGALLEWCSPA